MHFEVNSHVGGANDRFFLSDWVFSFSFVIGLNRIGIEHSLIHFNFTITKCSHSSRIRQTKIKFQCLADIQEILALHFTFVASQRKFGK